MPKDYGKDALIFVLKVKLYQKFEENASYYCGEYGGDCVGITMMCDR